MKKSRLSEQQIAFILKQAEDNNRRGGLPEGRHNNPDPGLRRGRLYYR